ncbi:unnamed protein product, partial [Iphiclides podalirius]
MKFHYKMESVLITITAILCTILLLKLLHNLRSALPWRVNCWFCNCNSWVKFPVRNCWICPKCEQYNGFTKDGDYNRVLNIATEQTNKSPKVFQNNSPKNGLCKMCNINQQLKVTQLANFVPMNDKMFDEEIESYRLQLEKAYKLCSPCKKILQSKLHKEKETFLGSKLLQTRTPEKKQQKHQEKQSQIIKNLVNVFAVTSIAHKSVPLDPILMTSVKLSSVLGLMLVYRKMKSKTVRMALRIQTTPKKVKNLANGRINSLIDEEDSLSLDTDDDVSLSKFGLHNFTDSSNETLSPLNKSLSNGRSFTPRTESVWGKPKLNSTFCVNPVMTKSPNSVSDSVFIKPSFNKYQNLAKSDSDSELDESISSLCIGPKKGNAKSNPVFGLRKFNPTPCFAVPTPLNGCRPLISPSKLGHSTSWVAGGYWGSEGERQIFNINGSRSSSQSSGFESQTSSVNQRNPFSQPPSREDSVCGEPDRTTALFDRFHNYNPSNCSSQHASSFAPISSPVFPQMQYNRHVQIPRPRLAQQTFVSQNVFAQQQPFPPNGLFKTPGGSGLIKLPQDNIFASR